VHFEKHVAEDHAEKEASSDGFDGFNDPFRII
jgi:hypothetical protein